MAFKQTEEVAGLKTKATIYEIKKGKWTETEFNLKKEHIILFDNIDGKMVPIGIAQY